MIPPLILSLTLGMFQVVKSFQKSGIAVEGLPSTLQPVSVITFSQLDMPQIEDVDILNYSCEFWDSSIFPRFNASTARRRSTTGTSVPVAS